MTPEATLREQMRKARAAKSLLDNEAFVDACAEIEREHTRVAVFDPDEKKRDAARAIVLALHEIRHKLERIEEGGQTAVELLKHRGALEEGA